MYIYGRGWDRHGKSIFLYNIHSTYGMLKMWSYIAGGVKTKVPPAGWNQLSNWVTGLLMSQVIIKHTRAVMGGGGDDVQELWYCKIIWMKRSPVIPLGSDSISNRIWPDGREHNRSASPELRQTTQRQEIQSGYPPVTMVTPIPCHLCPTGCIITECTKCHNVHLCLLVTGR